MDEILKLNDIFKNIHTYNKTYGSKTRSSKISLTNAVYYRFLYSKKDITKQQITSKINFKNNEDIHRTCYDRKENNIHVDVYKHLFDDVVNLHKKICCSNDVNKISIIAVDGTYGNTNIDNKSGQLETSLSMGYYDVTNNIPINLEFKGALNKNKELLQLVEYIKEHKLTNVILVLDRAYFKYEFFNDLIKNNIKFVIRCKNNAEILKLELEMKKTNKQYALINDLRSKTRIVEANDIIPKTVMTKNHTKIDIEVKADCKIITNLTDVTMYTNKNILDIYRSRWDVEIFFKYLKYNFKFENLHEKNKDQYAKLFYCELIMTYIAKIITHLYLKKKTPSITINKRNKKVVKCSIRINESNLINGIFDNLLHDIINSNLDFKKVDAFCKSYICLIKNEVGRSSPRIAKTPFKKWYVKGYLNIYKFTKMIECIQNNTLDKLNKNLKVEAKNITIIKTHK